jgi:hypothetical protein
MAPGDTLSTGGPVTWGISGTAVKRMMDGVCVPVVAAGAAEATATRAAARVDLTCIAILSVRKNNGVGWRASTYCVIVRFSWVRCCSISVDLIRDSSA